MTTLITAAKEALLYLTLLYLFHSNEENTNIVHKLNYDAKNKYAVGNPQNRNELP